MYMHFSCISDIRQSPPHLHPAAFLPGSCSRTEPQQHLHEVHVHCWCVFVREHTAPVSWNPFLPLSVFFFLVFFNFKRLLQNFLDHCGRFDLYSDILFYVLIERERFCSSFSQYCRYGGALGPFFIILVILRFKLTGRNHLL